MPRERRISVRLPEVQMDRVQEFCEDTDHDISHVVRQSLDAFLAPKSGTASNSGPPKRLSPPQAIIPLTVPYRAWGNGDARRELRRLFTQLLAASFALKELYPHTKGPKEIYQAFIALSRHFGMDACLTSLALGRFRAICRASGKSRVKKSAEWARSAWLKSA
jgi:hypothetical protein